MMQSRTSPIAGSSNAPRAPALRLVATVVSILCALTGLWLARHYPLGSVWALGGFVAVAALAISSSLAWLVLVPALLPVIGLAPWSGWITFEEFDLLVLAVATGGYARLAWSGKSGPGARGPKRQRPVLWWLMLALFAVSLLVAMARGFNDPAGGFSFGWFQGYHEPMNSLRLAKSFLLALLLLPLWLHTQRQQPDQAGRALSLGLMLGLAAASLATIWERLAFTGLLNFSSDYRTTGLFWEMHVGGAALDGFLALTVPFAVRELLLARTPVRWGIAAVVTGLASYACLTTFSRGVYLAIPLGLALFLWLQTRQSRATSATAPPAAAIDGQSMAKPAVLWPGVLLLVVFGLAAAWMFGSSGYRGMLALLGCMALLMPLAAVLRGFNTRHWLFGLVLGAGMSAIAVALAWMLPKGPYWVYALGVVFTAAMLWFSNRQQADRRHGRAGPWALAGYVWVVTGTGLVAAHWGESTGLLAAAPVLLVLLGLMGVAGNTRRPMWPGSLRWQATALGLMALVGGTVGVFGGGVYMQDRFSQSSQNLDGRLAHWRHGLEALVTPAEWLLGKGLGRFPSTQLIGGQTTEHPGDYRLGIESGNSYLSLSSGRQKMMGYGELFRVSQRVSVPESPVLVRAKVRVSAPTSIRFEVCEKHLLYIGQCVESSLTIRPGAQAWHLVQTELKGGHLSPGAWYAPRLITFSVAVNSRDRVAQVDDLQLTDRRERNLLANGDFSSGMARWFFSSDLHHLPWHIKNMLLNVLFEQGLIGLALWSLLYAGALWRLAVGRSRTHPLAPALAGALAGFAIVGLFDSLLDVPRLAWLYYTLLLMVFTLVSPSDASARQPGT